MLAASTCHMFPGIVGVAAQRVSPQGAIGVSGVELSKVVLGVAGMNFESSMSAFAMNQESWKAPGLCNDAGAVLKPDIPHKYESL